ncbi:uncharacterized protein ARMOST_11574 [Armillaria ostoyae]|uniref:Uncharacterized protein n=1 Tax=Armillaria ostoyae TaxID=47428 RepID=A0A284RHI2_ARMOS|nr:uncharacterized protein ARMOST_11574 [Armillaria ostoyae]
MTDHIIPEQDSGYYEDEELEELLLKGSGTLVSASDEYVKDQLQDSGKAMKLPEVVWVTPITTFNRTESSYMAYGNEPSVGYLYGDACLIDVITYTDDDTDLLMRGSDGLEYMSTWMRGPIPIKLKSVKNKKYTVYITETKLFSLSTVRP